ncbi:MAG: hypothetical protein JNL38_25860 [Myxococcales bacterium]|nr:hypothetical protein [Myxococcales bacterium]
MTDRTLRGGAWSDADLDLEGDRALLAAALGAVDAPAELPPIEGILAVATARRRARTLSRRRTVASAAVALGLAAAALAYARTRDRDHAIARPDPAAVTAAASAAPAAPDPRSSSGDDEPTCTPYERMPAPMSECPALASGRCEVDDRR